jgi:hypothetical protein
MRMQFSLYPKTVDELVRELDEAERWIMVSAQSTSTQSIIIIIIIIESDRLNSGAGVSSVELEQVSKRGERPARAGDQHGHPV